MVSAAHAVVEPNAVVIHPTHAEPALGAVLNSAAMRRVEGRNIVESVSGDGVSLERVVGGFTTALFQEATRPANEPVDKDID